MSSIEILLSISEWLNNLLLFTSILKIHVYIYIVVIIQITCSHGGGLNWHLMVGELSRYMYVLNVCWVRRRNDTDLIAGVRRICSAGG